MRLLSALLVMTLLLGLGSSASAAQPNSVSLADNCSLIWREISTPNVGALLAVKAIADDDVWAGGTGDFLHWDGSAWNTVPKPVEGYIESIQATASDNVWAYVRDRDTATAYVLQWDGAQWVVSLNPQEVLKGIVVFAPTDIWAMGYATVYYQWDGTTWTEFSYTTPVPDADILELGGVAPDDLWAVGAVFPPYGPPLSTPKILHWDGNAWSESLVWSNGFTRYFAGLAVLSPDDIWVVGHGLGQAFHWHGNAWNPVAEPLGDLESVTALAADNIYAVGAGIVHWDGSGWSVVADPPQYLRSVSAVSATNIWSGGEKKAAVLHGRSVMRPQLTAPQHHALLDDSTPTLRWEEQSCAAHYKVLLKRDARDGRKVVRTTVTDNEYTTPSLDAYHHYFWRVRACDRTQYCSKWSKWREFYVLP